MAPDVQKRVPMVWWNSPGFERAAGLRAGCLAPALASMARQPITHDHLFHTLLGALDVGTALHEPGLDLMRPCRDPSN
jgi:lipid A ethanolaminephosphotransferase